MNILKSINATFSKFWRWIKETAWVQPLLIVGGIFAIIFSISKFNKWFSTMAVGTSTGYFTSYRLSLENEGANGIETQADKLTQTIRDYSFKEFESYDEAEDALADTIRTYGKKYFLVIVSNDCTGCEKAEGAFGVLQDNWDNSVFPIEDDKPFRLHSIYSDEISTNDTDYDLEEDQKAFYRYVKKFDDLDLWAQAAGKLLDSPYKSNESIADAKYTNLENADAASWETPTIYLVDWTKAAFDNDRFGLSEVIFGFSTDKSDYDRATLLQRMWNHCPQSTEESAKDKDNPFREEYQK